MCTHPITINHKFPTGQVKSYVVPCGKCSECRALKQQQFAALSVIEGLDRSSMAFFTFTYSQFNIPVHSGYYTVDGPVCDAILRGAFLYDWQLEDMKKCCDVMHDDDSRWVCPSLYRKDIQDLIKRFRTDCRRSKIDLSDFAFSCFGEYGDRRKRPHYHLIAYGLSESLANRFASHWHFGEVRVDFIPRFNADGSDAFGKVSSYVSKYISKGDALPDFVTSGFAEAPRRQSSIGFGNPPDDLLRRWRNFT